MLAKAQVRIVEHYDPGSRGIVHHELPIGAWHSIDRAAIQSQKLLHAPGRFLSIERRFDAVLEEGPQGVGVMVASIARMDRLRGRARLTDLAFCLPGPAQLPGDGVDQIGQQRRSSPLPVSASTVVRIPPCPAAFRTPGAGEIPVNRYIPGNDNRVLQAVSVGHNPTPL
jgi:hypothetical protein